MISRFQPLIAASILMLATGVGCGQDVTASLREPLRVVSIAPPSGSVDVPLEVDVVVSFSQPMDEASLTDEAFWLEREDGEIVMGAMVLDAVGTSVVFQPSQNLEVDTSYRIQLASGVTALSGERLAAGATATFRCRSR